MRIFSTIIIILISLFFNEINAGDGSCIIDIQSLSIHQPIFIKPNSDEFFFPNEYRKISLKFGEQIELYCENTFKADLKNQNLLLTCGKDKIDRFLECNGRNNETARYLDKKCTSFRKDAYLLEIGFEISNNNFLKLMEICYNRAEEKSIYSINELGPYSGSFQMNVAREYFKSGEFHPQLNISRLYSRYIQKQTFKNLLGEKSTNRYLQSNSLARGHLAPMADFIFAPHQLATFYYVNVAPQWDSFNSGNWVVLEKALRKLATNRKLYLEIYTGTYGISTLSTDEYKKNVELYLHVAGTEKKVPVPKIYFKLIIDKATRNGVVIIGVNNPHISEEEIKNEYVFCQDIKDQIKWIKLSSNIRQGYMYACNVKDFVKTVKFMQFVKVKGLLSG